MVANNKDAEKPGAKDQTPVVRDKAPPKRMPSRRRRPTEWDRDLRDSFNRRPDGWKSVIVPEHNWRTQRDKIVAAGRSLAYKMETRSEPVYEGDEDYDPTKEQVRIYFNAYAPGATPHGIPYEEAKDWYKS